MLNYYFLFFVLTTKFAFIDGYNEQKIGEYINTSQNFFQFAVYVENGVKNCTGTIISKRHVLTAAHCVYVKESFVKQEKYQDFEHEYSTKIRTGIIKTHFKIISQSKVYVPITYEMKSKWSDIAIIEYPKGTNLDFEPVKLAKDYIEKVGDEAYIAKFEVVDGKEIYTLRHTKVLMKTDIFGTLGFRTGLEGDIGGPMLIYRNNQCYQIGVSAEKADVNARDYHTRISSYCNFIDEVTKGDAKCESIYPENYLNGQMLPIKHFEPIYKGINTQISLFDFVVPLYNLYYLQGCTATVISRKHLLTSAYCVYREELAAKQSNIHLAEYWSFLSISGTLRPDFIRKNVPKDFIQPTSHFAYIPLNYKSPSEHNIAVVEFPDGTDFGVEPVTLAKDYFQTYLETLIIAGYGKYEVTESDVHDRPLFTPVFEHSKASFETASETNWKIYSYNEKLMEDEGGPVLIDRNGKFYQIGVNYYGSGNSNGSRTFVSSHCDFIEEVTKNEVKCESILPIYDMPPPESGAEKEPPAESDPQPPPIQTENEAKPSAAPLASALVDPHPLCMTPKMYQLQFPLFSVISFLILLYL